jgi:colanic acid/amylovoran biosynthesis glycosyltransferase
VSHREPAVGYVLWDFPKLSETFILTELLELERRGVRLHVLALRAPVNEPMHESVPRLQAPVAYFPPLSATTLRQGTMTLAHYFRRQRVDAPLAVLRHATEPKTLGRAITLAHWIEQHRIGHLHAHFASVPASTALAAHRLTGVPFSFTAHAVDLFGPGVSLAGVAQKLRAARFAVTVSDHGLRHLKRLEPSARLVRIYNGLDLAAFPFATRTPETPPLVLGIGRLVEKKGFEDLVRACALLFRQGRDVRALVVGSGPLRRQLEELARELGIADVFHFAGALPREDVAPLYRRAAVVAVPSVVSSNGDREGLPTTLVEAMAAGAPVVATNSPGINELAHHERTSLLVREHDPPGLARAIRRILDEPVLANSLAQAARAEVEERFDVRKSAARLHELFAESLAAR